MTTIAPSQNALNTLISFGLEERVAKLYLSLLDLGQATVLQLAKKSGVERTVIYYLLKDLRRYGLVREMYGKNNRLLLVPAPPNRLLQIEEERAQEIKSLIPELKALHRDKTTKPKVRLFEGLEGIDALYDDVLATLKGLEPIKREMLTYSSIELLASLPIRNQAAFREARSKYQIPIRVIAEDSKLAREFQARDQQELRESRLLSEKVPPFRATFVVYANKVAMYNLKGDISILLIENKDLADLQRTVFELAWESAAGQTISVKDQTIQKRIKLFNQVRELPYEINGVFTAEELQKVNRGGCGAKHRLLKQLFEGIGLVCRPGYTPYSWSDLNLPPALRWGPIYTRPSLHAFLQFQLDGRWVTVDATWDSGQSRFPANINWDGVSDLPLVIEGHPRYFPADDQELASLRKQLGLPKRGPKTLSREEKKWIDQFNRWLRSIE